MNAPNDTLALAAAGLARGIFSRTDAEHAAISALPLHELRRLMSAREVCASCGQWCGARKCAERGLACRTVAL